MQQLILATGNHHKVEEFELLLKGLDLWVDPATVVGGMPAVEETGKTFKANATLKADALRALAPKGAYVLADDSGLEVDQLHGEPGVHSARYAGLNASDATNRNKLLAAMEGVDYPLRAARFCCVLCLCLPDGSTKYFEGICEGLITTEERGTSGFGYDSIFMPKDYGKTFSELGEAIKAYISHRAIAVKAMRKFLKAGN